jgi:hypothetical protein
VHNYRNTHGAEPICKVLRIAPPGYRRRAAQKFNRVLVSLFCAVLTSANAFADATAFPPTSQIPKAL